MYFKDQVMEINRNNYESFFLLYLDGELIPSQRMAVEKFLGENADLQKEFSLLQQTVLPPSDIVFEPKELLFRKEEKRRIIPFYRTRIAAAVAVFLLGSWFVVTQVKHQPATEPIPDTLAAVQPVNAGSLNKSEKEKTDMEIPAATKNQNAVTSTGPEKKIKPASVRNPDQQKILQPETKTRDEQMTPAITTDEAALIGAQKSSSNLEVQSSGLPPAGTTSQTTDLAGDKSPALMLSTAAIHDQHIYENAVMKESDYQNENAISVVALNDQNKGIAGFFKKLTKREPADENSRKLRVSVFQISY
jgi:hypothetical protein